MDIRSLERLESFCTGACFGFIPLIWIAKDHFDPNGFGAALLAIGGTGHHLPGFIRAYTDPLLFRRFRTRFIFAPLFFLGVYVLFSALHLESLKLVLILWGTWHGAMQVNGFLRIYDAKVASFSTITAWLDWAMCLVWFGGALFFSSRLISILTYFFNAGGAPLSPALFNLLRQGWMTVLAGVTVAFVVNAWKQLRLGVPPNPIEILMMASSFALWWFAMIGVSSLLVGLLLFEIIHDVQYNALVWVYNERRVATTYRCEPRRKVSLSARRRASFALRHLDSGVRRCCGCTRLRGRAGSKRASTQRELGQLLDRTLHGFNLPALLFRWLHLASARERFPAEHWHWK